MIGPIDTLDAAQLTRAWVLYEEAFAEPLRAPFGDLLAHRPDERFLAMVTDGAPVGLAFVRDLGHTSAVFLRYFAIDRSRRGTGVGTRFWRALCAELFDGGATLLYLDVEDPDEPGISGAERTVRSRRIAFYARLGAIVLPVHDYAPPHGSQPHPMLLLAADLRPALDGPLRPGGLAEAVRSVYEHRYGMPGDDPVVRATLASSRLG